MILIINVCKEKLHYYEFVKPIEDILKRKEIKFFTLYYKDLTEEYLNKATKIIICGTSLNDNQFLEDVNKFKWIKEIDKPILGICAGMQLIGLIFGGNIKNKKEIGYYEEIFDNNFLGMDYNQQVYHLHNNYVEFPDEFQIFCKSNITQAVKYKNIYGTLFHPEVRNKELILNFSNF